MINNPNPHENKFYGQELILNLYGCNLKKISSAKIIKKYILTLCDDVIHMKRYGEPIIPHFGHEDPITAGYSMVQLIETSSITGHFSEHKRTAYINIFSCAWFDAEKVTQFTQEYFDAHRADAHLIKRD